MCITMILSYRALCQRFLCVRIVFYFLFLSWALVFSHFFRAIIKEWLVIFSVSVRSEEISTLGSYPTYSVLHPVSLNK